VEISSRDRRLRAAIEGETECRRHYGSAMCKKLRLRIEALDAADSLADFWPPKSGPERCHELEGSEAGVFSMDVKQPYRLLFKPNDLDVSAEEKENKERWMTIKSVELLTIEDTHG